MLEVLAGLGYAITADERPVRVELRTPNGYCVDVHPLQFDDATGAAFQPGPAGKSWRFEPHWFTTGTVAGEQVGYFTTEAQRHFREGYEPRDVDRHDLAMLDRFEKGDATRGLSGPCEPSG